MKNIFYIVLLLTCAISFGQEKTIVKQEVKNPENNIVKAKDSLEIQPEPIGGFVKFYKNLQNKIKISENQESGTYQTRIKFIVGDDGSLSDFQIVKETPKSIGLGEEVIRVLKTFPKWKPGSKKTYFVLPVTTVVENVEPKPKKE